MQLYRSKRFCFSFSQRHQTQLVCLVRFVSCPRTVVRAQARRVYLSGYMGVQVSRRTRMQMGSQLIQGRNNDNPFSFFADDPTYLSFPTIQFIAHDSGKIQDKNFSFPLLLWMWYSRFAFEMFAIEWSTSRISNCYRSLLKLFWCQVRDQDRCIDKITSLQLFACTERYLHT